MAEKKDFEVEYIHPTKLRLIAVASHLLTTHAPNEITVDKVLNEAGISIGSLYHHFIDLGDLLDNALSNLYASFVDASIEFMHRQIDSAKDKKQFRTALHAITSATQGAKFIGNRATRSWIIAESTSRPRLRKLLKVEQDRLTTNISEIIKNGQDKGWVRSEIDPVVLATFIQAYTLGHIIDDIATQQMSIENWISLINNFADNCVLSED